MVDVGDEGQANVKFGVRVVNDVMRNEAMLFFGNFPDGFDPELVHQRCSMSSVLGESEDSGHLLLEPQ